MKFIQDQLILNKNFGPICWEKIEVVAFDSNVVQSAIEINSKLKLNRKQIDIADLFIAATAVNNDIPLATLNRKHFERIETLILID